MLKTTTRRDQVLRLYRKKYSVKKIADTLGITAGTVYTQLRRCGITIRYGGLPVSNYRVLAELLNTTDTYAEIGRRLELSRQRVHQIAVAAKQAGIAVSGRLSGSDK